MSSISKRKAAKEALKLFTTPQSRVVKDLPKIFLQAEHLHFNLGGIEIVGYRWNHPSSKRVLLLHGYESTIVNFESYIKPLIEKGYEVLAFDAPAHGRSGGKSINVINYKDMIKTINKLYGEVHAYIAHSFGGLAVSIAMEELEHDHSHKLILIAPAAETETALNNFTTLLNLNDDVINELRNELGKIANKPVEWFTIGRVAENIKATIRFYQDELDYQTPMIDIKKIQQKNLPNTEFVFSKGLGHNKIYRDAGVIKSIMDYL